MMKHKIEAGMELIGADGVHVGTVDRVVGDRIELKRRDSGDGRTRGIITISNSASWRAWRAGRSVFLPMQQLP